MGKSQKLLLLTAGVLMIGLSACQNQLLPSPALGSNNTDNRAWAAPENVRASHGGKRTITLSWDSVKDAARYYIYKADSPLMEFTQYAETLNATAEYKVSVSAGASLYFRIRAVDAKGNISPMSSYVRGTSLAQPVISDITESDNDADSSATVHWYMNNIDAATYQNQVRYIVYCFDDTTEVARLAVNGSATAETSAAFSNLSPNTNYTYQVEAYLDGDQNATEISEKMDAATARRLRPNAPENARATKGTSASSITIYFDLPEMVDVSIGNGMFELHPLYFVISRREAGTEGEFQTVCPYFGTDPKTFPEYTPGITVAWEDTSIITSKRGTEYEYKIQSYADGVTKIISSNSSIATASGWVMKKPVISTKTPVYYLNPEENEFERAELSLNFSHDPKGIEYTYILHETIAPVGDNHPLDHVLPRTNDYECCLEDVEVYTAAIDLTRSTTALSNGRGLYSYSVDVYLDGTNVETVQMVGTRRITENIEPVVVENFAVADGYPDKYVIEWTRYANRKYVLAYSETGVDNWVEITEFDVGYDQDGDICRYEYDGQQSGITRYFSMYAKTERNVRGEEVYVYDMKTLGTPVAENIGETSYDTIKLAWTAAQMADTYRVNYEYDDSAVLVADTVSAEDLVFDDISQRYTFSFKPEGYNNAARSGKLLSVSVEAINRARETANGDGVEIKTSSAEVGARLVGPAELSSAADQGRSVSGIDLGWTAAEGAKGYYVVRRQFDMNNSAVFSGNEILYYIDGETSSLTGKELVVVEGTKEDTSTVSASVQYNTETKRYTLTDSYLTDTAAANYRLQNYTDSYVDEQNNLAWGYPYRYYVLPVLSENDVPSFTHAGAGTSCSVSSVIYTNISPSEQTGFAVGFGRDVKGTKATYYQTVNTERINNGVRITWKAPLQLEQLPEQPTLSYYIYRKAQTDTSNNWTQITLTPVYGTEYIDRAASDNPSAPHEGVAYDYLVGVAVSGIAGVSRPDENSRFITSCYTVMDETLTDEYKMAGYVLAKPTLITVSKASLGVYHETVSWNVAGTDSSTSGKMNRGLSGYEVQVYNRNIDGNWHSVLDVPAQNLPSLSMFKRDITNDTGYLKVLRDYKHYFRVRAYVLIGEDKVYSSPPDYTWSDGYEDPANYVKWGSRDVTNLEFAKMAIIGMSTGMEKERGTRNSNSDGIGITGLKSVWNYMGATDCRIQMTYTSYVASHASQASRDEEDPDEISAVIISGDLWARGGIMGQKQERYWTNSPMTVTYAGWQGNEEDWTGTIDFEGTGANKGSGSTTRTSGGVTVVWHGEDPEYYSMSGDGRAFNLPFMFAGTGYSNDTDEWK
ncbi:hypothetical protein K7I13_03165 [Brucepastera parasyntrophica]|uniref:hypothetical protein n=1 Tax=Brucepastera parasyntrophica TaxID=2880008 RepID=UPI00210D5527|nr:hypothetical protein [Brucepastera parasyntrophica]ULQ60322.1 hypothetical protein K7I13_03165 [Brucepastera parasyntrophica]